MNTCVSILSSKFVVVRPHYYSFFSQYKKRREGRRKKKKNMFPYARASTNARPNKGRTKRRRNWQ